SVEIATARCQRTGGGLRRNIAEVAGCDSHDLEEAMAELDIDNASTIAHIRSELRSLGSLVFEEDPGVLATIVPGEVEGHFRVDPQRDGSWHIWWTLLDEPITITGSVTANALAALAGECLRDARRQYAAKFGDAAGTL